jgi:hypothetical protein
MTKEIYFWGIIVSPEIGISYKLVIFEASTKSHVHQKSETFWINIASTMAYPNFKNGPKNGLCPLGIKIIAIQIQSKPSLRFL